MWAVEWGTERDFELEGALFVDATGTGTLGHLAGADYAYGWEGRAAYDEALQPDEPSDAVMGNTMYYRAVELEHAPAFDRPGWAAEYRSHSELGSWRWHPWPHFGHHWLELGHPDDPILDNEKIRRDLIGQVVGFWDHLKNHCDGKAERFALDWISPAIYRRESRRLIGDYVLTQHDVQDARLFDDAVCFGVWPIDIHPPGGMRCYQDVSESANPFERWPPEVMEMAMKFFEGMRPYSIPFRCLYSRNVPNLFSAGRNISCTYVAFSSSRILPTGAVTGHAAGTAPALASRHGLGPRALFEQRIDELQQLLLREDAYIPGISNQDPADLAHGARAEASSDAPLRIGAPSGPAAPLSSPIGQIVPLTDRLERVEVLMRASGAEPQPVWLRVRPAETVWFFDDEAEVIGEAHATAAAGELDWVAFELGLELEPGLYFLELGGNEVVECALAFGETDSGCSRAVLADATEAGTPLQQALDELVVTAAAIPPGTVAARKSGSLTGKTYGGQHWSYHVRPPTVGHFAGVFESLVFRCSPESRPYEAANVVSGTARPERWTNLWISDPEQPLPQWVSLRFPSASTVGAVSVTFDTNLSRLPEYPHYVAPECVRDYAISVRSGGAWTEVVRETGNFRRHRVHHFEPVAAEELRLTVESTNGDPSARVFELRAYAELPERSDDHGASAERSSSP